jgi:DNA polymerase-1
VFNFGKSEHKEKLFFEILKLKAVNKTQSGKDAIDKDFVAEYKDRNFVVAKYGEYKEALTIMGTFVKGWYKRLRVELDALVDSHLRADFMFHIVDTGRLASANPNFQNIPARGPLSKIIKEMFIAEDGRLLVRFDFSAHEVRGWSIVSGDMPLAEAFRSGQKLRQQWVKLHPPNLDLKFPLTDEQVAAYEKELKELESALRAMP